ncbi:MAG: acetyl-CoA hydrolase [Elusimicrobia bacterium]|nr:MAG: acetyl-CoA hydrolase [Elusimicrobiota bacterium]
MPQPQAIASIDACVERIVEACGEHIVLATPLGLGKPNRLINALYRRIARDPGRRLTIHTALSLDPPSPSGDIERRFAGPFLDRHFGPGYPRLEYVAAMQSDSLPANVHVHEFYFQSGSMLRSGTAQRDYVSLNYTQVARDVADSGVNVVVQAVARRMRGGTARYSLSCNPDVTLDLLDCLARAGMPKPLVIGVVHAELPFLGGDADIADACGVLDIVLEDASSSHRLFALPREDVDDVEYAIGLHASTLVADGGTLQIGIGALSDALVQALILRHQRNADYREILEPLEGSNEGNLLAQRVGGDGTFRRGLYGSSEMIMDGFMHLRKAGILGRMVFDDAALQSLLDEERIGLTLSAGDAATLRVAGFLPKVLDQLGLDRMRRFGILPAGSRLQGGYLHVGMVVSLRNDFDDPQSLTSLEGVINGRTLCGGRYLQGGFCLGSTLLYEWLRNLRDDDYDGLSMNRISEVNRLQRGQEALATRQRRKARFFNTCMMATPLGAAVSDALEDGRVVSGVGGQYDFVSLASQLDDARSILMLRATRTVKGRLESNIRWNYGHATIPRHMRDIFVSEYGIADLRGKSDQECVVAMLAICDARFHDQLVRQAIHARKLPSGFRIPEAWKRNTREDLGMRLAPFRVRGLLPAYPFGSDFSALELRLLQALGTLKRSISSPRHWPRIVLALLGAGVQDAEALARMGLSRPRGLRERILARLLGGMLREY